MKKEEAIKLAVDELRDTARVMLSVPPSRKALEEYELLISAAEALEAIQEADEAATRNSSLQVEKLDPEDEAPDAIEYVRADEFERLKAERDALEAHLERIKFTLVDTVRCLAAVAFPDNHNVGDYQNLARKKMEVIEAISKKGPKTSLVKLKAKWQAELLEEYRERLGYSGVTFVDSLTDELRRQADGGE